jgi:hypothetical protein
MMTEWVSGAVLFGAGCVAGALNVVAGGGSFLTLPILIFLGLPATVANGTNRVAILLQNVGAVWGFHAHGVLDWRSMLWAALPCTVGGVIGTWVALVVSDATFQRTLAVLMVGATLWTLWDPLTSHASGPVWGLRPREAALAAGFFLAGIYGGFVQAGVGFLLLAATTIAGLDLVRGNAVKVLSILILTAVSLPLFAWQGKVDWAMGLILAAGNLLGGLLGVRLTVLKGHAWVKRVVTATVLLFALKLWVSA